MVHFHQFHIKICLVFKQSSGKLFGETFQLLATSLLCSSKFLVDNTFKRDFKLMLAPWRSQPMRFRFREYQSIRGYAQNQ